MFNKRPFKERETLRLQRAKLWYLSNSKNSCHKVLSRAKKIDFSLPNLFYFEWSKRSIDNLTINGHLFSFFAFICQKTPRLGTHITAFRHTHTHTLTWHLLELTWANAASEFDRFEPNRFRKLVQLCPSQ